MSFIELNRKNAPLDNEISITTFGRVKIAHNLMKYFPSETMRAFIDVKNKKLGLKDSGPINIRFNSAYDNQIIVNISELKKYAIKHKRYNAEWSNKHKMVLVEIEFNDRLSRLA